MLEVRSNREWMAFELVKHLIARFYKRSFSKLNRSNYPELTSMSPATIPAWKRTQTIG